MILEIGDLSHLWCNLRLLEPWVEMEIDDRTFLFVTGPNMSGKSTYIRSVALTVLLAQIGSFVPCDSAEISLVDSFFTLIGACDKPSKAMSTFMSEMLEIKDLLKNTCQSSLFIIDEMGSETSTFDGCVIEGMSWAISRYIAETVKAPCLFATHFNDLTSLKETIPRIGHIHFGELWVRTDGSFLNPVKQGACNKSSGVHVAKLAKFPTKVSKNAEELNIVKKLRDVAAAQIVPKNVKVFYRVPSGKIFSVKPKSLCTSESPIPKEGLMEIDHIEDSNSTLGSTLEAETQNSKLSNCENLLKVLEEMEKKICQ